MIRCRRGLGRGALADRGDRDAAGQRHRAGSDLVHRSPVSDRRSCGSTIRVRGQAEGPDGRLLEAPLRTVRVATARPEVIVEHYTGRPDLAGRVEHVRGQLACTTGELPGTCAHFIIDRDGTIYQLVHLWIRCRHAVGMNSPRSGSSTSGTSDRMVLGDAAQMHSSLRLTLWLMARVPHQHRQRGRGTTRRCTARIVSSSTRRGSASCMPTSRTGP